MILWVRDVPAGERKFDEGMFVFNSHVQLIVYKAQWKTSVACID